MLSFLQGSVDFFVIIYHIDVFVNEDYPKRERKKKKSFFLIFSESLIQIFSQKKKTRYALPYDKG